MSRPRDLHLRIRTAVLQTLVSAAAATPPDEGLVGPDGKPLRGFQQDKLVVNLVDQPCFVVFLAGAEIAAEGTNGRDDIDYPVSVVLIGPGPSTAADGEKPDLTRFRAAASGLFHWKRLAGVPEVLFCKLSSEAPVVSEDTKNLDQLRTGVAIVARTRTGRG